jgi:hypothetical protein
MLFGSDYPSEDDARSPRQLKIDAGCVIRFVAFGVLMSFANLVPYVFTHSAYKTDGIEIAGWQPPGYGCRYPFRTLWCVDPSAVY